MGYEKPYCRPGESESYLALGIAILASPFCLLLWFAFFWLISVAL